MQQSWPGFQIIMWQDKTPAQYVALRALGVTAARIQANREGEDPSSAAAKALPMQNAGLRSYVENIATDFYSPYHRWFPDKPVNWKFLDLKRMLERDSNSLEVFFRDPGLSDPAWLGRIKARLRNTVRAYSPVRPLFFNLADEAGIADLSAAWDFDYSPASLAGMRDWLKTQYSSLRLLNREWGTDFKTWDDVKPELTMAAIQRKDDNYASWSDFKAWMDVAFARAVRTGSAGVHAGAPWALAGLEGAQMPGWGGYDYSQLAPAVDVMEIYDSADNLDIAESFNPNLVPLTTTTWSDIDATHRAWRELLRGAKGEILWDPDDQFVTRAGAQAPRMHLAAQFFQEIKQEAVALLLASRRRFDPIAIVYSPASERLQWMLDHRAAGRAWFRRGADSENEDNESRRSRHRALEELWSLGFRPRFVTEDEIAANVLREQSFKMVVLPNTIALGFGAAGKLRDFVHLGGTLALVGDLPEFDGHGRRQSRPMLADLMDASNKHVVRLADDDAVATDELGQLARTSGLQAEIRLTDLDGTPIPGVKQYLYERGSRRLVALLADPTKAIAETTPDPRRVVLHFRQNTIVKDSGTGAQLSGSRIVLSVGSTSPTLLSLQTNAGRDQ
ncbi:MAG TPA: alpha-amylase family protein [Rhizomicrobium sp.]